MSLIKHYIRIKRSVSSCEGVPEYQVTLDGEMMAAAGVDTLLTDLYKARIGDYPKFYKMDPLCRLGFVASELLLNAENRREEQFGESRGVVLFNAASSLADDRNYQETIKNPDAFFPSPSLFVYTLPNVLTGEIAIRNHYYGETNFIVLPHLDSAAMADGIRMSFTDRDLRSLLTGWVDCYSETSFDLLLFLVDSEVVGREVGLQQEIEKLAK